MDELGPVPHAGSGFRVVHNPHFNGLKSIDYQARKGVDGQSFKEGITPEWG
jgi:hypothetical protein